MTRSDEHEIAQEDFLAGVPVIDIGVLMSCKSSADITEVAHSVAFQRMVDELTNAATQWGFFYISNHGVSDSELKSFQHHMRAFFALPKEIKHKVKRHVTNSRGYFDDELTKNKTDWKEGFDFAGRHENGSANSTYKRMGDDENQWLSEDVLPGFQAAMMTYFDCMEHVAQRLLVLFAAALNVPLDWFESFFDAKDDQNRSKMHMNSSFLRLNYYPIAPNPADTMAVHHHTDAGALTVLLQDDDVASLQVFHRASQQWCLIPPRPGTFVINIGDLLQVWSNDRFQAPLHQVLANGTAQRFSAPFFYNPSYDAIIEPQLSDIQGYESAKFKSLPWYNFRLQRFQGDYADHGEEIQTEHYRI